MSTTQTPSYSPLRSDRLHASDHTTGKKPLPAPKIADNDRIRGCLLGGVLACSLYDDPDHTSIARNDVIRIALLSFDTAVTASDSIDAIDYRAAQSASDHYPHPTSYLSAAILCHILHRLVFSPEMRLSDIVAEALKAVQRIFSREEAFRKVKQVVRLAERLAQNNSPDAVNLQALALRFSDTSLPYTAFYCAFRYVDDGIGGIQTAFEHNETECFQTVLVGCVLGARVGYRRLADETELSPALTSAFHSLLKDFCRKSSESDKDAPNNIESSVGRSSHRNDAVFIGAVRGTLADAAEYDAVMHASHLFVPSKGQSDFPEELQIGPARIVCAGDLPRRFVIENRPSWQNGRSGEGEYIVSCYKACLTLAANNGARSIAFLPVTVDNAPYPLEYSVKVAVRTVVEFVAEHPNTFDKICWIVNDPAHLDACRKRIERCELARLAENGEF